MGLENISVLKGNGIILECWKHVPIATVSICFLNIRENVDSLDHIYLVWGTQCQILNMSVLFRV